MWIKNRIYNINLAFLKKTVIFVILYYKVIYSFNFYNL